MTATGLALLVLVALCAPFVLYYAVRAEHGKHDTLDREQAERVARRDTDETRDRTGDDSSGWD